jgi:hypothetical protein
MELDELKQKWDLLSQEVEKQKIINTKLLDNVINQKIKNLNTYSFLGCFAYAAIIPVLIMVAQYKHIQASVICTAIASMFILFLWECYNIYLLSKTKSYKNDLISAEKSVIKYKQSKIWSYYAGFVFIVMIVSWFFFSFKEYLMETNRLVVSIVLLACAIALAIWEFKWDIGRVKELKKSIDELKEFELE